MFKPRPGNIVNQKDPVSNQKKKEKKADGCNLAVQCLSSMYEALDSVPSIEMGGAGKGGGGGRRKEEKRESRMGEKRREQLF